MASLLVSLHEAVEEYIKKTKDKDLARKIGTEVLERSRQVAKKILIYTGRGLQVSCGGDLSDTF